MEDMLKKGKIFLVDDDSDFLQETSELLSEVGYTTETCQDPHLALEGIKSFQPDCVLLDMRMPSLDGQDLLLLIRRRHPDLAVIICSGVGELDARYLLKCGATDVLQKPFLHTTLFDAIDQAVLQREELTPVVLKGYNLRQIRDTILRKVIIKALTRADFNITHTASLMGISRQCLLRYIKRLQISY